MIPTRSFLAAAIFLVLSPAAYGQPEALTLSGSLEQALAHNYGIVISQAGRDAAAIQNTWGAAGRYPTVGFDAGSTHSYDLEDDTYLGRLSAGLGLNWTLFDGFRVGIRKERLEELEKLASGRLGVVVENTIEDVILAYYNVLLQKEQLQVLETVMNLSQDRYRYEQERRELGGSVTYNVLQAQNVYLADKAEFMNQEVVVRNAVRNLNFIMGVEPSVTWRLAEPFAADTTRYDLANLETKMRSGNQTLINQYTNLLLKERETALRRADYSPSLSLGAGVDASRARSVFDGESTIAGSLSPYGNLRLSFDIYMAGTRKRALQVARINEEAARVETEEMVHALTNELYNLFDFHQVRIALLQVAEENLAAAELNLSISEEKYRSGAINSFNFRDIQLIYLHAALGRLQAIYRLIESHTQLTRITGGFLNETGE